MNITVYHSKYYASELTKRHADKGIERLLQCDVSVCLNQY